MGPALLALAGPGGEADATGNTRPRRVAYPFAVRRFAPLAAVGIASLACAACGARSTSEPAWVVTGVKTLRAYFLGTPRPETVTWGRNSKHRWVTVVFRAAQTCAPCHGEPVGDTGVVTGRRATITWAATGPSFYSVRIRKQ